MPYKTGELKGQLTSAELRKLIKAHNKLYTIKVPSGATQPQIVKLINDNGYNVNHKKQSLFLAMKNLPRKISMSDVPKKVEPTALQKQKRQEAKDERDKKKKKELREAKVEAVKKFQKGKPDVKKKPVVKAVVKPVVKKKPVVDTPKPKRRQLGKTQKPSKTDIQKIPVRKQIGNTKAIKNMGGDVQDTPKDVKIVQTKDERDEKIKRDKEKFAKEKKELVEEINSLNANQIKERIVEINKEIKDMTSEYKKSLSNISKNNSLGRADKRKTFEDDKAKLVRERVLLRERQKRKPVKRGEGKFSLPSQTPKPVVIDKDKKPPKIDSSYKIIKVTKSNYPLDVSKYDDIRNIPPSEVYKNLVEKRSDIFYPWSSVSDVSDIMFLYILKDNRSNCLLNRELNRDLNKTMCRYIGQKEKIKEGGSKPEKTGEKKSAWECYPVDWIKKNARGIAEQFLKCAENDLALPIDISILGSSDGTSTHANMLLLNPLRMEAEHFEPHGAVYRGQLIGQRKNKSAYTYFVPPQVNLSPAITAINTELKTIGTMIDGKIPKLKYLKPADTCPTPKLNDQIGSYQKERHNGGERAFEGVVITEQGGYCQMWSLFHLDLRLKTLSKSGAEVFDDMTKNLTKEMGVKYIELMRGMSRYAWEQLADVLKPKYNEHGATRTDLINFMIAKRGGDRTNNWKITDSLMNLKIGLYEEIAKQTIPKSGKKITKGVDKTLTDKEKKVVDLAVTELYMTTSNAYDATDNKDKDLRKQERVIRNVWIGINKDKRFNGYTKQQRKYIRQSLELFIDDHENNEEQKENVKIAEGMLLYYK